VLSVESVGLRFIVMCGDHGEVQSLLESAKDWFLGVDPSPPGEHVPPCVRYGMTYLLIRDVVGSVSCLNEWEVAWSFAQSHMVQEGSWYRLLP
jgi:hypothetical protein